MGIHTMSGDSLTALAAWLIPSVALGLPFALVHYFPRSGLFLAFLLATIPPLGLFGLPTSLSLAGFLFPGWGFAGILLLIGLYQVLFCAPSWRSRIAIVIAAFCLGVYNASSAPPKGPEGWIAHDLELGSALTADFDPVQDFHVHDVLARKISDWPDRGAVHVFPEGAAGRIDQSSRRRLGRILGDVPVIAGGETREGGGGGLDNVIISSDSAGIRVRYAQRMPAPWFMWRPGHRNYFQAGLDRKFLFSFQELEIGAIICYEIALPFISFATFMSGPDVVLVLSNLWWSSNTNIHYLVLLHGEAWSRLFDVPVLAAVNR